MSMRLSNIKALFFFFGISIILSLSATDRCSGYIMPAEQLIDFMTKKFSGYKTLAIIQSTLRINDEKEVVFSEQIITKAPDLFHLKMLDQRAERPDPPDMTYRQLLMANSGERIERLLAIMGINLETVSLTRINGIIAYRIGEKGPDSPRLLIEKERFLPLLLVYRLSGDMSGETITVSFQDYREQDKGWFPFEINCSMSDRVKERYTILTFQANNPVNSSILQPFNLSPDSGHTVEDRPLDVEEERLRKIIKAFEEKYQ
jgi:hypothetical protein